MARSNFSFSFYVGNSCRSSVLSRAFVTCRFLFRVSTSRVPSGIGSLAERRQQGPRRRATPRNTSLTQGVYPLSHTLHYLFFAIKLSSLGQRAIKRASNTLVKIVFILIMMSGAALAHTVYETTRILINFSMH